VEPEVAGSRPVSHPIRPGTSDSHRFAPTGVKIPGAPLAQLVEHRTFNPLVPGSSPGGRTEEPVAKPYPVRLCQLSHAFCDSTVNRTPRRANAPPNGERELTPYSILPHPKAGLFGLSAARILGDLAGNALSRRAANPGRAAATLYLIVEVTGFGSLRPCATHADSRSDP
jgi:hypothetical protein